MSMRKTFTEQVVVRMNSDLREALEANAEQNGRTVTQTIRFLLERSPDLSLREVQS